MGGGFYGADVAQLTQLSEQFSKSARALQAQGAQLTAAINSSTAWKGRDADEFTSAWGRNHRVQLNAAVRSLTEGAKALKANAVQQQQASVSGSGGTGAGGSGTGGSGTGSSGTAGGTDVLPVSKIIEGGGLTAGFAAKASNTYKLLSKGATTFLSDTRILDLGKLKLPGVPWADDMLNATSKFSKFMRFAGPAMAPIAIIGGIHDIVDPDHTGWRGVGDRIGGGLSVISGGGTLLMAAGLLGPVGAGIVVGAGLVAGAWALGNFVYDHWDDISGFVSDTWEGAQDVASEVWEGAQDLGGKVVEGAKDFITDPIGTIGGLFS